MAGSPFFARIKTDVVAIMRAVPRGGLVTFLDIGRHLDVAPRHVAYILAQLDPEEAAMVPWFRAVSEEGIASTTKAGHDGRSQRECLAEEGHVIAEDGRILAIGQRLVAVATLESGVVPQTRPSDAPVAKRRPKAHRSRT